MEVQGFHLRKHAARNVPEMNAGCKGTILRSWRQKWSTGHKTCKMMRAWQALLYYAYAVIVFNVISPELSMLSQAGPDTPLASGQLPVIPRPTTRLAIRADEATHLKHFCACRLWAALACYSAGPSFAAQARLAEMRSTEHLRHGFGRCNIC